MNNYITYYYKLYPKEITNKNDFFYFVINNEKYFFMVCHRSDEEIDYLYQLNLDMLRRNLLVHEIILNKDGKALTIINNIPYILMKVYVNENKQVDLAEINFINHTNENINLHKALDRTDWATLWGNKIDFFEQQINEVEKKYPILSESLNYFIGLGENAISYVKNTNLELRPSMYDPVTISHKRIKASHTLFDLYNPLSFIIDYKVRDISEYIKESFFAGKDNWPEIDEYLKHNRISPYSLRLLYARLLFPSYYFDTYESIIDGDIKEEEIIKIITKISKYEQFLNDFYECVSVHNYLPPITWLNKKTINKN